MKKKFIVGFIAACSVAAFSVTGFGYTQTSMTVHDINIRCSHDMHAYYDSNIFTTDYAIAKANADSAMDTIDVTATIYFGKTDGTTDLVSNPHRETDSRSCETQVSVPFLIASAYAARGYYEASHGIYSNSTTT